MVSKLYITPVLFISLFFSKKFYCFLLGIKITINATYFDEFPTVMYHINMILWGATVLQITLKNSYFVHLFHFSQKAFTMGHVVSK